MSKKKSKKTKVRADPTQKKTVSWLCSKDAFEMLTCQGYTSLAHNPEIITGVGKIAKLIGSMTIHLMHVISILSLCGTSLLPYFCDFIRP